VSFEDLASADFFAGSPAGFVRLVAEGDLDRDGFAETVLVGETHGWQEREFRTGTETFATPFAPAAVFSALVDGVSGNRLSMQGKGLPSATPHYVEIASGEHAGHRFEVDEAASTATELVVDLGSPDAVRNTLTSLPTSVLGARVVVRPHQTVSELFPPDQFQWGRSIEEADRVLFFIDGTYETLWLFGAPAFPARWIAEGDASLADLGRRVVEPGMGLLVRRTGALLNQRFHGVVRSTPVPVPLVSGPSLLANPWPVVASPNSLGLRLEDGFNGATTPDGADQAQIWRGDVDAGATGFDLYYLLRAGAFQFWVAGGDASLTSFSDAPLVAPTRAVFLQLRTNQPAFSMPVPWQP
jgi:hypothetical protein